MTRTGTGSADRRDGSEPVSRAPRPLRRDAAENLDRVLDVATAVFAEQGFEISIEVVAQRAGVGLGTIYRRFANKAALVDELARRLLRNAVAIGERHIDHPEGGGLFPYLWEIGALLASQSGIVGRMWNVPGAEASIARSREVQAILLRQAQERGLVREDAVPEDVAVICWSVSGVLDVTRSVPVTAWRRHLELCVEGLRPSGRPLREAPLLPGGMDVVIFGAGEEPGST